MTDDLNLKTDLNFVVTPGGDVDRITGLENLKKAILRRILTSPGSLAHQPNYGVGIKDFQNAKLTLAVKRKIGGRIDEQLRLDERISKVLGVSISQDPSITSMITISIRVEVDGYGEQTFTYEVGDIPEWR